MTSSPNPERSPHSLDDTERIATEVALETQEGGRATGAVPIYEEVSHQLAGDPSDNTTPPEPSIQAAHDPYTAFRNRNYRLYAIGGLIASMGGQMRGVAIGWELYERTHNPLYLGYMGLAEFAPALLLALPAGHIADSYNRQRIILFSYVLWTLSSLGLLVLSLQHSPLLPIYGCLILGGIANAMRGPASTALLPQLLPREILSNAITWDSSRWQLAATVGPALGGFVIAWTHGAAAVYALDTVASLIFIAFVVALRPRPQEPIEDHEHESSLQSLLAGLAFVRRTPLIFATITMDMFAVLLGGATALLPLFAKDILHVDATGLGIMRAAPAVGAMVMALSLAHMPPLRRAGSALLWSVAGFGAATIVFGMSRNYLLSLLMLFLLGALDNISVVVRHTLVQVLSPDNMRGRISAVNSVFIGTSNELGALESGLAATYLGPVAAVAAGGVGTILVVLFVTWIWPQVRQLGSLENPLE